MNRVVCRRRLGVRYLVLVDVAGKFVVLAAGQVLRQNPFIEFQAVAYYMYHSSDTGVPARGCQLAQGVRLAQRRSGIVIDLLI